MIPKVQELASQTRRQGSFHRQSTPTSFPRSCSPCICCHRRSPSCCHGVAIAGCGFAGRILASAACFADRSNGGNAEQLIFELNRDALFLEMRAPSVGISPHKSCCRKRSSRLASTLCGLGANQKCCIDHLNRPLTRTCWPFLSDCLVDYVFGKFECRSL